MRIGTASFFLVALLSLVDTAATVAASFDFSADKFVIIRQRTPNELQQVFFQDTFSDGDPAVASFPPDGFQPPVNLSGSYFIDGAPTEAGGRLLLDSTGAVLSPFFIPLRIFESAFLLTNTDNPTFGLNIDTRFSAFARYDLRLPEVGTQSGYFLQLSDSVGPGTGDDRTAVGVFRRADGRVGVSFSAQNPADPMRFTVLDFDELNPADFTPDRQIVLALVKSDFGDTPITAFWRLSAGPLDETFDLAQFTQLAGSRDIYTGEIFSRASLVGVEFVPEPSALVLLASSLLGLAVSASKRRRSRRSDS